MKAGTITDIAARLARLVSGRLGRGGPFLLAAFLIIVFFTDRSFESRVVSVPDGDTLVVYMGAGKTRRVRLYGLDCPELGQPYGPLAAETTSSLTLFTTVSLTVMDTDRYDRLVAVVTLPDGGTLNEELLRRGLAWLYGRFCKAPVCAGMKIAEREARREKRGLWEQDNPQAPWKWRAANPR